MGKTHSHRLILAALLMTARPSHAGITSQAPGNLFVSGQRLEFRVDVDGAYEMKDYFGAVKASGQSAGGRIDLPALDPGWYELRCGQSSAYAGVVLDRGREPLPEAGRVCADAASAWLVRDESLRKPFARMVRLAGIPWVRERLRWNDIEKTRGQYQWGRYDAAVDSLAAEGIRISEIWHDTAEWALAGEKGSFWPADLRDLHGFARKAAAHYKGKVQAWEIWNEPDIFFWPELADRYSGLLKSAALGIRAGDPKALILQGALCNGPGTFACHLLETGPGPYFDVFNWHIYKDPLEYPAEMEGYRALFRRYGLSPRPSWVSEAGVGLTGTEGKDSRFLNPENLRAQARFLPKSVVLSLASGNQKNFFFVLPEYLENGKQFGSLQPDLTPHPAFIALSAAANFIGLSRYLGRMEEAAGVEAHVFKTPRGTVVVAWSEKPAEMDLPTDRAELRVTDLFGSGKLFRSSRKVLRVALGPEPIYVLDAGSLAARGMKPAANQDPPVKMARAPQVVAVGSCRLPLYKDSDQYLLGEKGSSPEQPFQYQAAVYNFARDRGASGSLRIEAPEGWVVDPPAQPIGLKAGDRATYSFKITPARLSPASQRLVARVNLGQGESTASVSTLAVSAQSLKVTGGKKLDWDGLGTWTLDSGTAATLQSVAKAAGEMRFDSHGEKWFTATLRFDKETDLTDFDGISCQLSGNPGLPDTAYAYLSLLWPGSQGQNSGQMLSKGSKSQIFLFRDMDPSPDPAAFKKALGRVTGLKFAVWTSVEKLKVRAGGFKLVRMTNK